MVPSTAISCPMSHCRVLPCGKFDEQLHICAVILMLIENQFLVMLLASLMTMVGD